MIRAQALLAMLAYGCGFAQTVQYATYLGGRELDVARAVAVDRAGNIYIAGETHSRDFPTVAPMQAACALGGLGSCSDGFVARMRPDGTRLDYSTFFGSSGNDSAAAIAVNDSGDVFVTGTWDDSTAFAARFNASGRQVFLTRLGGPPLTFAHAIALDRNGNSYITGQTSSAAFPVVNGLQPAIGPSSCTAIGGGSFPIDAFVAKIGPAGQLLYSTFLGGSGNDVGRAIAVDIAGNVYVAGGTSSRDFPIRRALQPVYRGGESPAAGSCSAGDAFLAKIDADGRRLVYSTFLGGTRADEALAVAVDGAGFVTVGGSTASLDLPIMRAAFPDPAGGFVARLGPAGDILAHSSYAAGPVNAITLQPGGAAWIADGGARRLGPAGGSWTGRADPGTSVLDLAVSGDSLLLVGTARPGNDQFQPVNAMQPSHGGFGDAYIARFVEARPAGALTAVSAASFTGPELAPQSIATIFGTDMAGASIDVADRLVEVFGSTDTQASFVVPDGLAIGPVRIAAVREGQVLAEAEALIDTVSPGIFTAAATGSGVAAAQVVHTTTGGQLIRNIFDCSEAQSCMAAPIELFEDSVLVLYGTGIRAGTPIVRIGGLAAQVLYSGPHSLYLGLDQLNVKLPLELRGRGTVDVLVDVDGRLANLVQIAVR